MRTSHWLRAAALGLLVLGCATEDDSRARGDAGEDVDGSHDSAHGKKDGESEHEPADASRLDSAVRDSAVRDATVRDASARDADEPSDAAHDAGRAPEQGPEKCMEKLARVCQALILCELYELDGHERCVKEFDERTRCAEARSVSPRYDECIKDIASAQCTMWPDFPASCDS